MLSFSINNKNYTVTVSYADKDVLNRWTETKLWELLEDDGIEVGRKLIASQLVRPFSSATKKDNFSRKIGRKESFAKLIRKSFQNKEDRKAIWTLYFNKFGRNN